MAEATAGPADRGPDVPRRSLLRAAGTAGLTALVVGTSAVGYRVFDTSVLASGDGEPFDPWHDWRRPGGRGAVGAAVLAANPHNTQPWTFALSGSRIDLFADERRGTGALDPLRRERDIGLGCALENLALAVQARGVAPDVRLLPDGPQGDRVASVASPPDAAVPLDAQSPIHRAIGERHTDRGPFLGQPVPGDVLDGLVDLAGADGVGMTWVTAPDRRAALGDLMVRAAEAVTRDGDQSRDGFAWFRPDADAVRHHRDGLTLDGQGLPPVVVALAKLLPPSSREAGDRFWVQQTREVHTRTAAAYGILTALDPHDRATRLRAGRLLQRIHLTATSQGLALHHMNQITERIDRERALGTAPGFGPAMGAFLPGGVAPVAAFRVGRASRAALLSPRRPASAVLR